MARTNGMTDFNPLFDCVVGVFYGTPSALSVHYKDIQKSYPVICGQEFWERLTGDAHFYDALINAFAEVADEINCSDAVENVINTLAKEIEKSQG